MTDEPAILPPGRRRHAAILLFIILAGVAIRLPMLSVPLGGVRMLDTAAVARNFHEESMNIFYPRVDWRGSTPGYVEAEFPIYSFVIAILYHAFGVHEWLGRLVSVGTYALSALFLYRLCRRLFDPRAGLLAAAFFSAAPLGYVYTTTYQPDPLMALGTVAGIYYFWRWAEEGRPAWLLLGIIGINVAILIKPTNLYLGLPVLYLVQRRFGWALFRKPVVWTIAAALLIPCAAWFYHSWSLWDVYGNSFGILGGWNKVGAPDAAGKVLRLTKMLWPRLVFWIATPAGLLLLLLGMARRPPGRNYLLHWWTAGFGVSVLLAAEAHEHHIYYQLPSLFIAAAWMGYGATWAWDRPPFRPGPTRAVVAACCAAAIGYGGWRIASGGLAPSEEILKREGHRIVFGREVARLTEPDARVILVTPYRGRHLYQHRTPYGEFLDCDPVDFYWSHRQGWNLDERQATPAFVETLRRRGARYLASGFPEIFDRQPELKAALDATYEPMEISSGWALYRLGRDPVDGITVTVDATRPHQTMEGFGATHGTLIRRRAADHLGPELRARALDAVYGQVGLTTGHVPLVAIEAPATSPDPWVDQANDDDDPFHRDPDGFHFAAADAAMETLIGPARALGFDRFYPGLTVSVRWANPWMKEIRERDYDRYLDEAAEQVLAGMVRWRDEHGIVPPYVQLLNEPTSGNAELDPGSPQEVVDVIVRTGDRLRSAGFDDVRFVVPAEESEEISLRTAHRILGDERARRYVGALAYHTYPHGSTYASVPRILRTSGRGLPDHRRLKVRDELRNLARRYGIPLWMTEVSHGGVPALSFDGLLGRAIHIHDELTFADASAYFAMMNLSDTLPLHGLERDPFAEEGSVAIVDVPAGEVRITGMGRAIGHYARWIRRGAVRIETATTDPRFKATAFRDGGQGRLVLVLINPTDRGSRVHLRLLGLGAPEGVAFRGERSTAAVAWQPVSGPVAGPSGAVSTDLPARSVTTLAAPLPAPEVGQGALPP